MGFSAFLELCGLWEIKPIQVVGLEQDLVVGFFSISRAMWTMGNPAHAAAVGHTYFYSISRAMLDECHRVMLDRAQIVTHAGSMRMDMMESATHHY